MTGLDATAEVVDALEELGIPYMVVGSFSSNVYGIPRSTHDADFVIVLGERSARVIADRLGPRYRLDPQMTFESVTMTTRFRMEVVDLTFTIELFLLSDDAHDQERFGRRQRRQLLGRNVVLPTPEDVIVTKLRWAIQASRPKDMEDIRDVIAVQGDSLDWDYIHHWTDIHGSRALLEEIRRSIPPL